MKIRTNPPSFKTVMISLSLFATGLFGAEVLPLLEDFGLWLIIAGYLTLLAGSIFKGI